MSTMKSFIGLLLFITLIWPGGAVLAAEVQPETRYISDTLIVTLRDGPGPSYTPLKALKTGTKLTVLDKQKQYLQVQTENGVTGWLKAQYTIPNPPGAIEAPKLRGELNRLVLTNKHLSQKIKSLKDELAQQQTALQDANNKLTEQNSAEQASNKELQDKVVAITNKYNELLAQSQDVIKLKKSHDILSKTYNTLRQQADKLRQENQELINNTRLYWFLAGGGIFLIGWLIGKSSLKKKRSSLSL
jgi:SH3 domain protein